MPDAPLDSTGEPDWTFDVNRRPREQRTDPRLPLVQDVVSLVQPQLRGLMTIMQSVETVIRDCAANGMTPDEIADQCSLTLASVNRVLSGGTLFGFSSR